MSSFPQLHSYAEQCRTFGMTDEQIRQSLRETGWAERDIITALGNPTPDRVTTPDPSTPPESATPLNTTPRSRHWGRWLGFGSLLLLLAASGTVYAAEQGYLPRVSVLYRRVQLPLLWHGTTANPSVAFAKMAAALGDTSALQTQQKIDFKVEKVNPSKSAALTNLPKAIQLAFQPTRTMADISSSPALDCLTPNSNSTDTQCLTGINAVPSLDQTLPLSFGFTLGTQTDSAQNLHLSFAANLADLTSKVPGLSPYAPGLTPSITAEGIILPTTKVAYARSSLLTSLNPSNTTNKDKWLQFSLSTATTTALTQNGTQLTTKLDSASIKPLYDILKQSTTDLGISRKDSLALAHYQVHIAQDQLKKLAAALPKNSNNPYLDSSTLKSLADYQADIIIDLWLQPRTGNLHSLTEHGTMIPTASNIRLTVDWQYTSTEQASSAIIAPAKKDIITQPAETYLFNMYDQLTGGQLSAAQGRAQNATRSSDIIQIGKALDIYKDDHQNKVPSTGGVSVRLDNPQSILATNTDFHTILSMPMPDPLPDKYYYSYLSDGSSYTITAVQTDPIDGSTTATIMVKDGIFSTIPIAE